MSVNKHLHWNWKQKRILIDHKNLRWIKSNLELRFEKTIPLRIVSHKGWEIRNLFMWVQTNKVSIFWKLSVEKVEKSWQIQFWSKNSKHVRLCFSKVKKNFFLSGRVNENLAKLGRESHDTPKTVSVPFALLPFFAPGNRLLFCERHLNYFGMFHLYYKPVDLRFF